ncbi:MAG TPA: PAS domain-containing protein [Paracoccaceae bacterium]|nr:PAS domain-containing protein [Paracoccaceae bacterium]
MDLSAYRLSRTTDMIHSELRALYSYWNRLRAGRKAPLRSDIDPRDMACDARNLFILENLGRGNIRFRLAGTAIVDAFGMELRGMNARAIMASPARESFMALIAEALEDPGVGYARLRNAADESGVWEINLLPLRSDFGVIDRVIGCLHSLSGIPARDTGVPLRFRIEHMSVEPIGEHMSVEPIGASVSELGAPGLAEPPGAFLPQSAEGGSAAPPRLTAIDGDGDGVGSRRPRRRGDHLRLVKK